MARDGNAGTRAVRLLIALDRSCPNESILLALSRLLDTEGLEVTALYVEDEDLLRAAHLPGLLEVSLTGQVTALDPVRIARELAGEAASARSAFEALAERLARGTLRVSHRFLIARGRVTDELDRAAAESDFVLVTRSLHTGLRRRHGRSFAQLVRQPRNVLFVNEPWESGTSVVVLADGGTSTATEHAARLARAEGLRLVVAGTRADTSRSLPEGATERRLPDLEETTIAELCFEEDARLLVVPDLVDLDWSELLVSLMDRVPCSVLKLADR